MQIFRSCDAAWVEAYLKSKKDAEQEDRRILIDQIRQEGVETHVDALVAQHKAALEAHRKQLQRIVDENNNKRGCALDEAESRTEEVARAQSAWGLPSFVSTKT
jgi:predicted transcriptional regulator